MSAAFWLGGCSRTCGTPHGRQRVAPELPKKHRIGLPSAAAMCIAPPSLQITRSQTDKPAISASSRSLGWATTGTRSEEHTSELQSQSNLVCRLLLEKKKKEKDKIRH